MYCVQLLLCLILAAFFLKNIARKDSIKLGNATYLQSRTSLAEWITSFHFNFKIKLFYPVLKDTISSVECSSGFDIVIADIVRGPNKPPKKNTRTVLHDDQSSFNQNDSKYFQESDCVGATKNDNNTQNHNMYHQYTSNDAVSQTTAQKVHPSDLLQNLNNFAVADCERDNCNANGIQRNNKTNLDNVNHLSILAKDAVLDCGTRNFSVHSVDTGEKATALLNTGIKKIPVDSKPQQTAENSFTITADGYKKLAYAVLVGDTVRTCNTKLYASLPLQDKYMVKQRVQYASGVTRIKLVLKSSHESSREESKHLPSHANMYGDNDDVETDGRNRKIHYRGNSKKAGYIVYTCDGNFRGDTKYPLPNGKTTNSKIGKGGNGFVFIIYHGKKQYAVKQTVYRPNEVNVHSALSHVNVLPLLAVLMGEKHANHAGRFHCYHFMPKMDYDFRQILSTKEVGCLKFLYRNCSMNPAKFDRAFSNVKFILKETLKAISYIHSNGFIHRDVKASNIMIKMNCKCNPLYCECPSKFKVKLGDFDSAGTVPGLGIKEPTDQMIKFASILPLGTPGYRAPEVSMHIVLSGPYETLYTTAVDMWSFGCLCLNICIGKTAAVKQREEALLLLSNVDQCFEELWIKTTKIQQLEKTQPFANDIMLLHLIRSCLRIDYNKRLSATDALTYL